MPALSLAKSPRHLHIESVCKNFGPTAVLKNVSLTVEAGEFLTILGPSGCGKTTLMRIIAGLEQADSGSVKLGDTDVTQVPANRRPVNTVFQSYALFPHLNVSDNVAFGLHARHFEQAVIKPRVERALDMLQLGQLQSRYPHQLSGGQRQRVAMARALVNEPEVLLLDEPMSALDARLRATVQEELRRLQQKLGTTFILVTHDQEEALTVSTRIAVMKDGRIEQAGSPHEVYERPSCQFVAQFLGAANLIKAHRNGHPTVLETAVGQLQVQAEPAWRDGTLAIRPEHIVLRDAKPSQNAVPGEVGEVIYRGAYTEMLVKPSGLRVRMTGTVAIRPEDRVWLELRPQHLHVLSD